MAGRPKANSIRRKRLRREAEKASGGSHLLQENGFRLLTEDGRFLSLESAGDGK
ncbi:MAG: hypothetical protein U1E62_26565 [Alsobacter sp.]